MSDWLDHPGIYEDEDLVIEEAKRLIARLKAREIVTAGTSRTIELPPLLTLAETIAQPRPPITYRIDGWQPAKSRVIADAPAKAGKTTLIGNLCRSLVDGEPFLGVSQVAPADRVGLLDFEMSEHQLVDWLADQRIHNADRVTMVALRGRGHLFNVTIPEIRALWADALRGVDYLIVDPLKPVLDALGLDEKSEAGKFLTPFDALLAEAGIPDAFIAHHQGHYAERSRGDSTLLGWPDVLWTMIKESDDLASPRYIRAYGRDVQQPEALLEYDPDTRHLTLAGGTRSDARARALISQLVDIVNQADEPVTLTQLNEQLEGRKSDISRASHLAEAQGLVAVEIGRRRARIHRPAITTGSRGLGTGQTPPVPDRFPSDNSQETLTPPDETGNEPRPVPTGSHQFPSTRRSPVPDIYMSEPVDRSEEPSIDDPIDEDFTGAFDALLEAGIDFTDEDPE